MADTRIGGTCVARHPQEWRDYIMADPDRLAAHDARVAAHNTRESAGHG